MGGGRGKQEVETEGTKKGGKGWGGKKKQGTVVNR